MKITINGSPKELAELARALNGTETEAKKADFPPLLTKLAEDEKISELAEDIQPALDKMNEMARQRKENAPQAGTAEQNMEIRFLPPTTIGDIKETVQSISECRSLIESKRS